MNCDDCETKPFCYSPADESCYWEPIGSGSYIDGKYKAERIIMDGTFEERMEAARNRARIKSLKARKEK